VYDVSKVTPFKFTFYNLLPQAKMKDLKLELCDVHHYQVLLDIWIYSTLYAPFNISSGYRDIIN
jgi:hypothetical protein